MNLAKSFSEISFSSEEWRPSSDAWITFNDFRRKGIFCDVVIKVDGVSFPVHRLVLCACSDYFRSLFLVESSSNDHGEVEIFGVNPEIMASLLDFAYTGQVIVTARNVQELLPAADRFHVLYVKEKCCSYLKRQLSPQTCIGIYKYAESFSCDKLKCAVADYMLSNFEEIVKCSSEFLQLSFEEVSRLVSDDRLNVRGEEVPCEAIFRWTEKDKQNRIAHLPRLLSNVRLGLLDPDYLMKRVNANEMVIEKITECQAILNLAMRAVHSIPSPETDYANQETMKLRKPRLPYDILVAVGGWSGSGSTNAIEAYDTRARSWVNITSTPGLPEDRPRAYHGIVFLNKCLFIIGGFDGVNYFDTVRKLNVVTNQWTEEPSMFHKRCYVSVVKMEGKIYALGGMDGQYRLNTAESYDPVRRVWNILPEMNEQRSDASAASLQNKIYICGGFNGQECLFTAEFYDPTNQTWTWITPMMTRRSGVSIVALNGLIYAVGGFDGMNRLRTAESYCPSKNTWTPAQSMNKARSNFGMDVIDGQIIAVGGFNGAQTTSDVESFDVRTKTWHEVSVMRVVRSALSCCVMDKLPYDVVRRLCGSRDIDLGLEKRSVSADSVVMTEVDEVAETHSNDQT